MTWVVQFNDGGCLWLSLLCWSGATFYVRTYRSRAEAVDGATRHRSRRPRSGYRYRVRRRQGEPA